MIKALYKQRYPILKNLFSITFRIYNLIIELLQEMKNNNRTFLKRETKWFKLLFSFFVFLIKYVFTDDIWVMRCLIYVNDIEVINKNLKNFKDFKDLKFPRKEKIFKGKNLSFKTMFFLQFFKYLSRNLNLNFLCNVSVRLMRVILNLSTRMNKWQRVC